MKATTIQVAGVQNAEEIIHLGVREIIDMTFTCDGSSHERELYTCKGKISMYTPARKSLSVFTL